MHTPAPEHGPPRAAPAFPAEAVDWLVEGHRRLVVSLASAQVTAALGRAGHHVSVVSDRSPATVDTIVTSHRLPDDLDRHAGLLRSGGRLTMVCSRRDHRIPWVRKLDALLGLEYPTSPEERLVASARFGDVEEETFHHWQVVNHESLAVLLREELVELTEHERETKVAAALALYADYGRGNDGMQMPWVSRCLRATVIEGSCAAPEAEAVSVVPDEGAPQPSRPAGSSTDPDLFDSAADAMLLIDFR